MVLSLVTVRSMFAKPEAFPKIKKACPTPSKLLILGEPLAKGAPIRMSSKPSLLKSPAEDTVPIKPSPPSVGPKI